MSDVEEVKTLEPKEAVALWLKGVDKWNAWVAENPDYRVNFTKVDFARERKGSDKSAISFDDYRFPKGGVSFFGAHFGDGGVRFNGAYLGNGILNFMGAHFGDGTLSFVGAHFGNEDVRFNVAHFGNGNVIFDGAYFGNGNVIFDGAQFGDGEVRFQRAQFGDGEVRFDSAQFGDGEVRFDGAQFGDGEVHFDGVKFGDGEVRFDGVKFGDGEVRFDGAQFGDGNVTFGRSYFGNGDVIFDDASFGDGTLSFVGAHFGDGTLSFVGAHFGNGDVFFLPQLLNSKSLSFAYARIHGNFIFDVGIKKQPILPIKVINFSHMTIDGYLSLGAFKTNSVIDLTYTTIGQTVQLDEPDIGYQKAENHSGRWPLRYHKAQKADAARCFRILKKQADDAKDHERKLDFFANEMRSDYGYGLNGMKLYLYLLYDKISDYGRSFIRPAIWLFVSTLFFSSIYLTVSLTQSSHKPMVVSGAAISESLQNIGWHGLVLAASHTVPFTFGSRAASKEAMAYLFCGANDATTILMHGLTIFQGVISTIFLFLMGLALRNFFRS